MLFSSYSFIFIFLPALILIWQLIGHARPHVLPLTLLAFSIVFYASQGLPFLVPLAVSICANYFVAEGMNCSYCSANPLARRRLFYLGLAVNILPLLWFKYSWFIINNLAELLQVQWQFTPPAMPPGISFYTFIQIAWLAGVYKCETKPPGLARHALFSCCFPYVLSGPIVRCGQVDWQYSALAPATAAGMASGIALFTLGLAKKVLLADSLAPWADSIFGAAQKGWPLSGGEAWLGSFCYTFQLYFDFSGYTDMALGIGLMLGLRLPENFNSPYQSTGIVDFWRRWHITLSSWLRDFLYIPLGGNRKGKARQYRNLFLTMLIGGAWHGAGWTYIIWGALHGLMLCVNHLFRARIRGTRLEGAGRFIPLRTVSILFTFFCINCCWVIFRAPSIDAALAMYSAMFTGPFAPHALRPGTFSALLPNSYFNGWQPLALVVICAGICWFCPNSGQIMQSGSRFKFQLKFQLTPMWAALLALLTFAALAMLTRQSVFLYFQF